MSIASASTTPRPDAPAPEATDPAYLTQALRRRGVLGAGRVRAVHLQRPQDTMLSRIVRLQLEYEGACDAAPRSLVLKTLLPAHARLGWNAGQQEVAFYAKVASASPPGLVPACYDAVCSIDGSAWHLLLEDLGETHSIVTPWPQPPSAVQAMRIVEARARFHAAWWDHAGFGASIGTWWGPDELRSMLGRFETKFARFLDRTVDLVTPERRQFYERLIAQAPRLSERYYARRDLTIVHGDGHFWNCFLARADEGVKFFDWDCWRIDAGTDDLAYMIAVHWYPGRRQHLERGLLDRYHATLLAHGVTGYDRAALDADYRLSVLWQAMTPVWQAGVDLPPSIWWNNYERVMMAVDDLGCRELLS